MRLIFLLITTLPLVLCGSSWSSSVRAEKTTQKDQSIIDETRLRHDHSQQTRLHPNQAEQTMTPQEKAEHSRRHQERLEQKRLHQEQERIRKRQARVEQSRLREEHVREEHRRQEFQRELERQESELHQTQVVLLELAVEVAKQNQKTPAARKTHMQLKNQLQQQIVNPPTPSYPKRQFGEYKCHKCANTWSSAYARQNKYQKCKRNGCETENRPLSLRDLIRSEKREGDSVHDTLRCQVCTERGTPCNLQ